MRSISPALRVFLIFLAIGSGITIWSEVKPASARDHEISAYCKTVRAHHTTALNTLTVLGDPNFRETHTTDGYPGLYMRYGKVDFAYDWTGELDSSLLLTDTC